MNDDFEQHLRRQPPVELPSHWRRQILAAAQQPRRAARTGFFPASLFRLPLPAIRWGALAAVWVVIIVLNHAARDNSPRTFAQYTPPSPQMLAELKQQQRMFAELIGPREATTADQSKNYPSRPRTQLAITMNA